MSLGSRLKEARKNKNLTQPELAAAIGISKGAIGNYEAETSSPNEEILIKLMKYLEVDANFLYQDYVSSDDSLSSEELHLLSAWRGAEESAQEIALETLLNHQKKTAESTAG